MADEKKLKQINKNAIFIHQLLSKDRNFALAYFSAESIEKVSFNSNGLQIFFKEYDLVKKCILRQKIEVKGLFYKIYPKVTNLTIIGIGHYATNSTVEHIMQHYGFIIDSYQTQGTRTEQNGYKTVFLTDDYRIILDVPEVFAPKLRPIKLPDIKNKTFEVLFFCRLCRSNGHRQFQCPKVVKSSSSSFRRSSYENDSGDSVINSNGINYPESNRNVEKRKPKFRPDSAAKTDKGQNYFPEKNCYPKESSYSSSITCHQSIDFSRQLSFENNFGDLSINSNETNNLAPNYYVDRKIRRNSHLKTEKEQSYPDQKCYSKNSFQNSSFIWRRMNDSRKSYEDDSGTSPIDNNANNSPASDKSQFKIHHNSYEKIEKEHIYSTDQSCHFRNKSLQRDILKDSSLSKSKFHSEHQIADYVNTSKKYREDQFSSMPIEENEKCNDNNSSATKEQSTESLGRRKGLEKGNAHQDCENEEAVERIQASSSYECGNRGTSEAKRKKKTKKFMHLLSSLLPPNTDLLETKKLINIALSSDSKNISEEVKTVLLMILQHNRGLKKKIVNECSRKFLSWIETVIRKTTKQENLQNEKFFKNSLKYPSEEEKHVKENENIVKRIQSSTSYECSSKRTSEAKRKMETKKLMQLLSSLLPPKTDLLETNKLINKAFKSEPKDIPEEVKTVLIMILKYNRGLKKKVLNEYSRKFLNRIEVLLRKIKNQEKLLSEKSLKDPLQHSSEEEEHIKDEKSTTEISKQQSPSRRRITLSLGIREAISKTSGELTPNLLCQFLDQVRGRKRLLDVVHVFTKNIKALSSQLLKVQNTYYKYVEKRGREEDRDVSYIRRLRERLRLLSEKANDVEALGSQASRKKVPVKTESDMTGIPVKIESGVTEISVKKESDITETFVERELDTAGMFVKDSDMTGMPVKIESDVTEISVKQESDITETFLKRELLDMAGMSMEESDMTEISVKIESDMTDIPVKMESGMTEISVKRESEIFMRQSSSNEYSLDKDLPSHNSYGANYFTNITQMPFS